MVEKSLLRRVVGKESSCRRSFPWQLPLPALASFPLTHLTGRLSGPHEWRMAVRSSVEKVVQSPRSLPCWFCPVAALPGQELVAERYTGGSGPSTRHWPGVGS